MCYSNGDGILQMEKKKNNKHQSSSKDNDCDDGKSIIAGKW